MEKKKEGFYVIETESDTEMMVGISHITIIDQDGRHPAPDMIYFRMYGYNSQTDNNIDAVVSISKEEALNLSGALIELAARDHTCYSN